MSANRTWVAILDRASILGCETRRATCDLGTFKKMNVDTAWALGIIYSDGCIQKRRDGAYSLSICMCDRDVIEKIRDILKSNHKIGYNAMKNIPNRKPKYGITVYGKELYDDLYSLGVRVRKSKPENMILPNIDPSLFPAFLRGVFDGDGSVGYCANSSGKKNRGGSFVNFTSSSYEFLDYIRSELYNRGFKHPKISTNKYTGVHQICYTGKKQLKLLQEFLYNGGGHYWMDRKYNTFKLVVDLQRGRFIT